VAHHPRWGADCTELQQLRRTHLVHPISRTVRPVPGGSEYALADPDLLEKSDPISDGVYYGLDNWDRSWVLAVDIDAKDIAKARAERDLDETGLEIQSEDTSRDDALLAESEIRDADPTGYPYSFEDINRAIEYGFETHEIFTDVFAAEETMVVYSGQGVHVYLLDDELEYGYDEKSREVLNDLLLERFEIPIDPVVTADRVVSFECPTRCTQTSAVSSSRSRAKRSIPERKPDHSSLKPSANLPMIDPRETERDAYLAAAIPTNYTDNEIVQLFARGYDRYVVNNTPDRETLLSDIERFGTAAFKSSQRNRPLENPFVDESPPRSFCWPLSVQFA